MLEQTPLPYLLFFIPYFLLQNLQLKQNQIQNKNVWCLVFGVWRLAFGVWR